MTDIAAMKQVSKNILTAIYQFIRCTYEEDFKLVYEQDDWVKGQHYQEMTEDEVLQLWKILNLQIIHVLDNYPEERMQVRCDIGKTEIELYTVEWLANDYLAHLQHHLNQIRVHEPVN